MPLSLLYEWMAFNRLEPFGYEVEAPTLAHLRVPRLPAQWDADRQSGQLVDRPSRPQIQSRRFHSGIGEATRRPR